MRALTEYERVLLDVDLPRVEGWIGGNPQAGAEVVVDREAFDSNMGHLLLVVRVRNAGELERARAELTELVEYGDRLRVRRWKAPLPDVSELTERVWARNQLRGDWLISCTWPDPVTGVLVVSLSRRDPDFIAELEAMGGELLEIRPGVMPHPEPATVGGVE